MVNGRRWVIVLGLLGGSFAAPVAAHAQVRAFVGGTLGASIEPQGPSDSTYLSSGLGGSALAGGLTAGVTVSPRVAIAFEASFARGFTGDQTGRVSGGNAHYERTHRDAMVSGVVRYLVSDRFVGVAGASFVRSTTSEVRVEDLFLVRPGLMAGPFTREYERSSPGLVLGGDITAARWGKVVVGFSIRLHWFDQSDENSTIGLGLGYFVARPGVNVEVQF